MRELFLQMPCWAFLALAIAIAWPIWHHAREIALFQRRRLLQAVTPEGSRARRWFWSGRVLAVGQVFPALLWAVVLLAFAPLLTRAEWPLLAFDAVLVLALIPTARRMLVKDVVEEHRAFVARRWLLFLPNVALLALAFFVLDFFFAGAPDTRGRAWHQVAEAAYGAYAGRAECAAAGIVFGYANALDTLAWHFAQVLIPSLPDAKFRIAAWVLALLEGGVVAWAFTRLLLGASALAEAIFVRPKDGPRFGSASIFAATVLVLLVLLIYLASTLRGADYSRLPEGLRPILAWTNPCRGEATALRATLMRKAAAARGDLQRARGEATAYASGEVDATVGRLFGNVEAKVDDYLDWYFSLVGQYQRLLADEVTQQLHRRLFGEAGIEPALEAESRRIAAESVARFEAISGELGVTLRNAAASEPCAPEVVDLGAIRALDRDRFHATFAAGLGVTAAVVARFAAQRLAVALASRLAVRQGFSAAAALAGRQVSRRAGTLSLTASAAAACAPGGPLAALCATVAGVLTWIAGDYLFVKIDEYRFRAQMRVEIVETVNGLKRELAADLLARQQETIDRIASGLDESLDRVFVPARHGI